MKVRSEFSVGGDLPRHGSTESSLSRLVTSSTCELNKRTGFSPAVTSSQEPTSLCFCCNLLASQKSDPSFLSLFLIVLTWSPSFNIFLCPVNQISCVSDTYRSFSWSYHSHGETILGKHQNPPWPCEVVLTTVENIIFHTILTTLTTRKQENHIPC